MSGQRLISALLVSAALPLVLAACASSTPKPRAEDFQQTETYSRSFASPAPVTCDAGKRALMSQGYFIDKAESGAVTGHKSFQEAEDNMHTQIQFQMVCSPNEESNPPGTTVFVNAVRDRYAIKRSATSASVGVSILGSVSMPIGSSADSLVKVASETIARSDYYDGFFNLLKKNLPQVADAESKPARHAPAKKAEPAPAPDAKNDKTDAFKSDATGPAVPGESAKPASSPAPAAAPAPEPAPAPAPTPAPASPPAANPPSSTPAADAPAPASSSSGSAPANSSPATPAPTPPASGDAAAPASTPPASSPPATP